MTSPLHSSYIPRMKWVQTEAYRQVVAMWVVRFREEINAVAFVRLFASHPVFLRDKHLFACRRCQRIRGRWLVVVFFYLGFGFFPLFPIRTETLEPNQSVYIN